MENAQEDIFEYLVEEYGAGRTERPELKRKLSNKIIALYKLESDNKFHRKRIAVVSEALVTFFDKLNEKILLVLYGEKVIRRIFNAIFSHNLVLSLLPERYPRRRILILGETGVGKENIADLICDTIANFGNGKIMKLNAAAFSKELLESELFGHVKGAFTGALTDKKGIIEKLDGGGVLFLDEIGEASKELQVSLLRVLETGEFRPLGSEEIKKSDFHFVSATNYSAEDLKVSGGFRMDLYQRICSPLLEISSFREILASKGEDERRVIFKRLHDYEINELCKNTVLDDVGKQNLMLKRDEDEKKIIKSLLRLQSEGYHWEGNIRECITLIREAFYQGLDSFLEHVQKQLEYSISDQKFQTREDDEIRIYKEAAEKCKTIIEVAQLVGVSRQTASKKLATSHFLEF